MDSLSLLPPVVAVIWVIWKKQVLLALTIALFVSELLINGHLVSAILGSAQRLTDSLSSTYNAQVLSFSLLIGVLLAFLRAAGGIEAFVARLQQSGIASTRRRAGLLSFGTGLILFIESNISIITAGILSRGPYDRFALSRARLAYIIDSTCAPVCIIILLNAWGAYVLGLLSNYPLPATDILLGSIKYNFYAWAALLLALMTILSDRVHGPMRHAESLLESQAKPQAQAQGSSHYFLLPLAILVIGTLALMAYSGNGDLRQGDSAWAILLAISGACLLSMFQLWRRNDVNSRHIAGLAGRGLLDILPLVALLWVSMSLGNSLKELGTGASIASFAQQHITLALIPVSLFLLSAVMSFSTGTSWGTFALMMPVAAALMLDANLPPSLLLGAVLSGGIFGDHCSPLSDTTAVSSMAAGCSIFDHVRTQMPYALLGGAIAALGFLSMAMLEA